MGLGIFSKFIAENAKGTFSMTEKKKTCLIEDGSESGFGANCDSFGFVQFAAWENPSSRENRDGFLRKKSK